VLARIVAELGTVSNALFVREPLVDPWCPATSDVDVLVLDESTELLPERRICEPERFGLDVVRLPLPGFDDSARMAAAGLLPHRLLSARLIHDPTGSGERARANVAAVFDSREARQQRLLGFLRLGADAVQEVGVTEDLPALGRFWLHMAFASLVATLADGFGLLCPNVYTRPFDYVAELERRSGLALEEPAVAALGLESAPERLVKPLTALFELVTRRFPEPDWPARMRQCTRYEYRYFSSQEELDYRIAVARELGAVGQPHAAVFSLRFWTWMLTCLPLVHARAREGIDVSFIRPQRAVGPDLALNCPEATPLVVELLGSDVTVPHVNAAVAAMNELRRDVLARIARLGIVLDNPPVFKPFERPVVAREPSSESTTRGEIGP
jgi:hypothetical protein